jgi:hypothetical protein
VLNFIFKPYANVLDVFAYATIGGLAFHHTAWYILLVIPVSAISVLLQDRFVTT